jgi:hypothetical protein
MISILPPLRRLQKCAVFKKTDPPGRGNPGGSL